jgi:hypothetical protein
MPFGPQADPSTGDLVVMIGASVSDSGLNIAAVSPGLRLILNVYPQPKQLWPAAVAVGTPVSSHWPWVDQIVQALGQIMLPCRYLPPDTPSITC